MPPFFFSLSLSPLGQTRRGASNLSKAPFCIIYWPLLHLPCRLVPHSEKAPLQSVRKTLRSLFTSTNRQAEGHSQVCVCACVFHFCGHFLEKYTKKESGKKMSAKLHSCLVWKHYYYCYYYFFTFVSDLLPLCWANCKAVVGHLRLHI